MAILKTTISPNEKRPTKRSSQRLDCVVVAFERSWLGVAELIVMPNMPTLPASPEELLQQLFAIFPQYRATYDGPIHNDTPTFHSVLIGFTPFFGGTLATFSEAQMRSFAGLVNASVEAGGSLENAFGTCLLEHLHQIRAERALRPYLSKMAREKTKA